MSNLSKETTNLIFENLEKAAQLEAQQLPEGPFIARKAKSSIITFSIVAVFACFLGVMLLYLNNASGYVLLTLGIILSLVIIYEASYRCEVNEEFLRVEYRVIFFKRQKTVLWNDIKYKKGRYYGCNEIVFYSEKKKKLLVFDSYTVGYSRIVKIANDKKISTLIKTKK